jgi:hypothetical protein
MRKFIHFTPMHKLALLQKSTKNVLKMNISRKNSCYKPYISLNGRQIKNWQIATKCT